jgi:hypothetical protein
VGSLVIARAESHKHAYLGRITEFNTDRVKIAFFDSATLWVSTAFVRPVCSSQVIAIGTSVISQGPGHSVPSPGRIDGNQIDGSYSIAYDDGFVVVAVAACTVRECESRPLQNSSVAVFFGPMQTTSCLQTLSHDDRVGDRLLSGYSNWRNIPCRDLKLIIIPVSGCTSLSAVQQMILELLNLFAHGLIPLSSFSAGAF